MQKSYKAIFVVGVVIASVGTLSVNILVGILAVDILVGLLFYQSKRTWKRLLKCCGSVATDAT